MLYQPAPPEKERMWDSWVTLHQGTWHLYYLMNRRKEKWDRIGLTLSEDGVHWKEHGPVLHKKDASVDWLGTGSIWKASDFTLTGRFIMNFSEWTDQQGIGFAESTDLIHWTRLEDSRRFNIDERWYEPTGRWDCIWALPKPDGGYCGYWTATPKAGWNAAFGFGQSEDGIHWEALKPPECIGLDAGERRKTEQGAVGVKEGEVGAVEEIDGRYYMTYGKGFRESDVGMFTLVAERPEGPFRLAAKNPRHLLPSFTYFTRFLKVGDLVLVNHHTLTRDWEFFFAPMKRAVVDYEGTLRLTWWEGNDALKGESFPFKPDLDRFTPPQLDQGVLLEGTLPLPNVVRFPCFDGSTLTIRIEASGEAQFLMQGPDAPESALEKTVDREVHFGNVPRFKLLFRKTMLELYLNEILIECHSLPAASSGELLFQEAPDTVEAYLFS